MKVERTGLQSEEFEILVEELMKDVPDQALVRSLMRKQGIPYTADPISQLGLVLQSLDQKSSDKESSLE